MRIRHTGICPRTSARKVALWLGTALAIGALTCAGLAGAVPRPSGTVTEAVPAAGEAVAADDAPASAEVGSGIYTRSDMPYPGGNAAAWLDVATADAGSAAGSGAGAAGPYTRSEMPRPSGSAQEWLDVAAPVQEDASAVQEAAYTRSDLPRPSGSDFAWIDAPETGEEPDGMGGQVEATGLPGTTKLPETAAVGGADGHEAESEAVLVGPWTSDADCASCHADEVASFGDEAAYAFDHAAMACVDCHTDTDALAQLHEGATSTAAKLAMLSTTDVPDDLCMSCHDQAAIAAATQDCTMLTDLNGTVVNPHELPDVVDHDGISCISCHTVHGATTDMDKTVDRVCASCHHAEVYECYTCHS